MYNDSFKARYRIVNSRHSLDAAWFVMLEGILTENKQAVAKGKEIIDVTLPLGIDPKHDGIIAFCDVKGRPPVQLEWDMKLWWPQCAALIALRLAYTLFSGKKYNRAYENILGYCEKYFIDKQNGEWYGYLHYNNSVSTTLKGNIFKVPFHIPRLYMIMDETESIIKYTE